MFSQINRNEKKPFFDFPKTKLKNISCAFCRREFIIRDFAHLRGPALPLLLSCGHAVCHPCVKIHPSDPCPLCPEERSLTNKSESSLLPINVYVTGLFGVIYNQPFTADEPDMSFSQSLRVRTKEYSDNDLCFECDGIATVRCLQCHVVYCHSCAEKVHLTLDQTEKHFRVLLTDTNKNSIYVIKTCQQHVDFLEYYCIKCDASHCSRCMLQDHQQHTVIPQLEKNMEHMDEFHKVHDELIETLQRVRQTQKKLQKMAISPGESESSEVVETAINQHFAHLHGVLQNIERRMIDKLSKQRNYLQENVRDIQARLKEQEDQLQSAVMMATTVQEVIGKINLRDVISELERLADAPCHLVRDPIVNDEKIMFCPDPNIIKTLENHCNIKIPKVSGYRLFRSTTLPGDYIIEPLSIQEPPKLLNESLGFNATTLVRTPSCQSVCSRRPEPQAFREGQTCLVHLCYIENPSNFYVRRWCYQDQIKKMEHQLSSYTNCFDEPSEVQINKIYAVKHATKNKWYRGRVKDINRISGVQDTYEVFDVDYGSTETKVSITQMRHISDEAYLSSMPQMAINCALYDIVPIDGQWRSGARKFMFEIAKLNHRGAVMMHLVNIKGNTYYVDICHEQISIRDSLIYMAHGTFVTAQYLRRTCPQAVRKFFQEDLVLESYCDVVCSHVESPDCIYVQKIGDHLHFLCGLEKDMSHHYNGMKAKYDTGMIYMPEVGLPCAVEKFEGQWCRAKVYAVPRPRMVEVFLVDFGSTMSVSYEKIRKLNERFMLSPTQAIKVTLTDIKPRAGEWCGDAIEFTKRHLEHKFVRVFAFEKKQSSYEVALYTNDEENHENFAALLAGSGLAVSTGPRSSGYAKVSENQSISKNRKMKLRNSRTKPNKKSKSKNLKSTQQIVIGAPRGRSSCDPVNDVANDPYRLLVKIVRIISPDKIYVCDISLTTGYEKMMTDMQKFYNKYTNAADCDWHVGSSCVCYSSRDRCFARGEIVRFESEKAQVFLYDFAVTETIPIVELQSLKKKFAIEPTYVCKVKLGGILPCGGSSVWPSTSCEKLKEIVYENQNSKFYISKVVIPGDEELNVELWVEEVKIDGPLAKARIEIKSINRALVDEGLALPIKQYNEKKTTVLALELQREISFVDEASKNESADWTENGNFKERRKNSGKASDGIKYAESFVSSASSVASDDDDEIENATSYLDSSTSNEDLAVANDTKDTLTPNDTKIDAWLPAEPIVEDHFVAVATNVDHSCCVYIYPKKNSKMVHYIEATLDAEYSTAKTEADNFVEEWKVGDLCIAQYHANKKWYRAEVLHVMHNNMIQVVFSDYGNIEECQGSTLRKRLALTDIARQCTKCEIAGLLPDTPNGKWRITDLDIIHSVLVDKQCEITVLERKSDCLVVSIVLLSPTRFHLLPYLINDLHLAVRADNVVKCTTSDCEKTIDNSDDVIIDGYVENVGEENIAKKKDEENLENNEDIRESINKQSEDGTKKDIKENGIEKGSDNLKKSGRMCERMEEPLTKIDNDISNVMGNETYDYGDFCTTKNMIELYKSNDVVISGTPNFTLNVDQIESSQREAENKLENEDSSDSNSIREDQIVASTPFDDSLVFNPARYKILLISKEVSPVKAEVVLVGLTKAWLHLLYNEKSESIRKIRDSYEKIMQDMQNCAGDQPLLKDFEKDTPCCAKYADGMWYRCKVLKCISETEETEQMVRVRFVDWGNEENVYFDEVRSLKDEWLDPPCMAFCCKLWGIIEGPSIADDEISKMKVRKAWKVDKKPPRPVYVKIEGRAGKFYEVRIYSDEKCTKLVYQSLLDDGLLLSENGKDD